MNGVTKTVQAKWMSCVACRLVHYFQSGSFYPQGFQLGRACLGELRVIHAGLIPRPFFCKEDHDSFNQRAEKVVATEREVFKLQSKSFLAKTQ